MLLLAIAASRAGNHNTYPLPEDRGTAGTLAALEKLPVYVRVLQTTAHPDDESAGTLTWLSRKFHANTSLLCLTRGEGGQNILGNEKYQELGLVRAGELFEACRYYGAELYFGDAVDFGFSKTAEETLSKWGHESILGSTVRIIRQWRPDIVLSRFQGTAADGHGHHQAAGILTREAFSAAADPQRFPDQLRNGLEVWKVKKLYVSSPGSMPGGAEAAGSGWTVRVPVGDYDPVLGRSYREIAMEGYSKHRTQGNGTSMSFPGRSFEYFKLEESSVGKKAREDGFFDSIDTSLSSIFELAGVEKTAVSFLQPDLAAAQQAALNALKSFRFPSSPEKSAAAVTQGLARLGEAIRKVEKSSASPPAKKLLLDALRTKTKDFETALNALLGIYCSAVADDVTGAPAEKQQVTVSFYNRGSEPVSLKEVKLRAQGNILSASTNPPAGDVAPGNSVTYRYSIEIAPQAAISDPMEDLFRHEIDAEATYVYRNVEVPIPVAGRAQAGGPLRGSDFVEFQIVPALSVLLEPDLRVAPVGYGSSRYEFRVTVVNNQKGESRGEVRLQSGAGLPILPPAAEFKLLRKGESFTANFIVQTPDGIGAGEYPVEAVAKMNGQEFRKGFHLISYPENLTRNFYVPATSKLERIDLQIAPDLKVGYIPGAGDEVPGMLEQIGVKVQTLSASDLAFGDLGHFRAIITGIRAYNVNEDLRANNRRLLDYVAEGGTLIVQYVRPMGRPAAGGAGSPFVFAPYPMTVSESDRITAEDSPVKILDPSNPVFIEPNKITEADFRGWVQERGLYFMNTWDRKYTPLLTGNDPGEEPKAGGMLYARYGKGHYIYTGYAWFRQLPAGVSGAFRIFANMLSLGKH
jgi:LmbE family N-acetylglucosaminyl deacetylase